ncbi:hypothetical protein P3S67_012866 [Capsicum chacoense]
MSMEVGYKIGQAVGGTADVVIPQNGRKEGQYMRIKVMMNIHKPLPRGKLIKLGPETIWVDIRYENGMLGHNYKACVQREKDLRSGNLTNGQFGTWLWAENHLSFSENLRRQG